METLIYSVTVFYAKFSQFYRKLVPKFATWALLKYFQHLKKTQF